MAQFDYYGTWEDSVGILRSMFEYDAIQIVHDSGIWQKPVPHYFHSLTDELLQLLEQRPFLFIYGNFSRFPPGFVLRENGPDAGTYRLAVNEGGPGLELGLPVCHEAQDTTELGSRFLSYPAKFLNPETQLWEKPSRAIRAAFTGLSARMRSCLCRAKANQDIFIGPRAFQLLNEGKATIIDRGISLS